MPTFAICCSVLLGLMDIRSATQDRSLLDALAVVVKHRHTRRDELAEELDLKFASQRWQSFVSKRKAGSVVSVAARLRSAFSYLADALQTGDAYIVGAENFGDYRTQLLPWAICQPRLAAYVVLSECHRPEMGLCSIERAIDGGCRRSGCRLSGQLGLTIDAMAFPI